nr:MAG TPA: hypothetical protein [Caudoviricetes sp.]
MFMIFYVLIIGRCQTGCHKKTAYPYKKSRLS